jgi:hypothetical protein
MTKAGHQPPSRVRYAASHPTVGIHLTLEDHQRAQALRERTGLSFAQLFLLALERVELDLGPAEEKARTEGYKRGYEEARGRYRLSTPCIACRRPVVILPGSEMAAVAVAALGDWGHDECVGQ